MVVCFCLDELISYNCGIDSAYLMNNLLTILGPTACGKTAFAARLAYDMNGEIISADSRQVYRGMDIGTVRIWLIIA